MSQQPQSQQQQQEPNNNKKWWQPGVKPGIAFCNLQTLMKYELDTCNLFQQPLTEGDRISTDKYDYRLKHSARFGWSVTRFEKTLSNTPLTTTSYDSGSITTTINTNTNKEQSQQQNQVQDKDQNKQQMQWLLDQLATLQRIRRDIDALIVSTQESLKECAAAK